MYRPCDNLGAKRGAVSIQIPCRILAHGAQVNFRQLPRNAARLLFLVRSAEDYSRLDRTASSCPQFVQTDMPAQPRDFCCPRRDEAMKMNTASRPSARPGRARADQCGHSRHVVRHRRSRMRCSRDRRCQMPRSARALRTALINRNPPVAQSRPHANLRSGNKFALPSGRWLCSFGLRDLSLIIFSPAIWSARGGALPRR